MTALGAVPRTAQIKDYLGGSNVTALGAIPRTDQIEAYGPFPAAPVAGYMAWYDAADTATLTIVSNKVSSWADKSANGHTIAQATAGNRPLYNASPRTINGVTIPEFDPGSGTSLANAGTMTWPSDRTSTAIFLALLDTTGGGRHTLASATADSCNQFAASTVLETTKTNVAVLAAVGGVTAGVPCIFAQRLTATTIEHFANGAKSTVSESSTFTAGRLLRMGVHFSGEHWDGLIAEALFYDTTLSDADLSAVSLYLMGKWKVPWLS